MNKRKRILSLLLSIPLLCAVPFAQAATLGDVDGNGEVEVQDARLALRQAVGLESFEETDPDAFYACDADGNGEVEVDDARLILRAAVGLEAMDEEIIITKEYSYQFSPGTMIHFVILKNETDVPQRVVYFGTAEDSQGVFSSADEPIELNIGPGEEVVATTFYHALSDIASVEHELSWAPDLSYESCFPSLEYDRFDHVNNTIVNFKNKGNSLISELRCFAFFFGADGELLDFAVDTLGQNRELLCPDESYAMQFDSKEDFDHVEIYYSGHCSPQPGNQTDLSMIETREHIFEDDEGTHYFVRVKNLSETEIDYYVNAMALDSEGNGLGVTNAYLQSIPAGEESVEELIFPDITGIDSFELFQHVNSDGIPSTGIKYLVADVPSAEENRFVTLRNAGPSTIYLTYGYALYFDENDLLIGAELIFPILENGLGPEEEVSVPLYRTDDYDRVEVFFNKVGTESD